MSRFAAPADQRVIIMDALGGLARRCKFIITAAPIGCLFISPTSRIRLLAFDE
jgi:hypothetical protein